MGDKPMHIIECLCGRPVNVAVLDVCPRCGRTAAQVRAITPQDRAAVAEVARAKAAKEAELAGLDEAERVAHAQRKRQEFVRGAMERMRRAIDEGRQPALQSVEFISSDYQVGDKIGGSAPRMEPLVEYGLDGWEIVAAVPRTMGMPLMNGRAAEAQYGGGIGGLVDGAYVLLRLPVTKQLLDSRPDFVRQALERIHDAHQDVPVAPESVGLPVGRAAGSHLAAAAGGGIVSGAIFGYGVSVPLDDGDDADVDFGE